MQRGHRRLSCAAAREDGMVRSAIAIVQLADEDDRRVRSLIRNDGKLIRTSSCTGCTRKETCRTACITNLPLAVKHYCTSTCQVLLMAACPRRLDQIQTSRHVCMQFCPGLREETLGQQLPRLQTVAIPSYTTASRRRLLHHAMMLGTLETPTRRCVPSSNGHSRS